jgi:hypothetical protein
LHRILLVVLSAVRFAKQIVLKEQFARGLYRRSGIAPCPEGLIFNCCDYNANLLQLRFDLLSRVFIPANFSRSFWTSAAGALLAKSPKAISPTAECETRLL